ncbi:MAG: D-aminoacyl-tRNA deacylase [Thermoplasmata archaeon]
MILIVASNEDTGSLNIKRGLLLKGRWEKRGIFDENEYFEYVSEKKRGSVAERESIILSTINKHHLYYDEVDKKFEEKTGMKPDNVIFISRHKSVSNLRTLTVHPIGNFHKAEYGGKERTLVPSCPQLMSESLRKLWACAQGLGYQISYEATHHGPYLSTPTYYIEVGSDENAWNDERAGDSIAQALISTFETDSAEIEKRPVVVGIGGGHYMPRMTEVATHSKVSFGHMVPTYAFENMTDEMWKMAFKYTPGAKGVYFHKKGMPKPKLRELQERIASLGFEIYNSKELDLMDGEKTCKMGERKKDS